MGGSFDPIHLGHLAVAEQARDQLGLEEVVVMPAGRPWQKSPVASAEDRYQMTQLAVEGMPGVSVSRIEIDRDGPTYTVDTLRELGEREPGAELWLLVGADTLAGLDTWREPEEVARLARFAVAARPGSGVPHELSVRGVPAVVLEIAEIDVSSTDIRRRLARGDSVQGLLSPQVEDYIRARGLYGAASEHEAAAR